MHHIYSGDQQAQDRQTDREREREKVIRADGDQNGENHHVVQNMRRGPVVEFAVGGGLMLDGACQLARQPQLQLVEHVLVAELVVHHTRDELQQEKPHQEHLSMSGRVRVRLRVRVRVEVRARVWREACGVWRVA